MADDPGDMTAEARPFRGVLAEVSDGIRSSLLAADGWADFAERLGALISALPIRRRQALVMLLFATSQGLLTPDRADEWIVGHEVDSDEGVEALIAWLRTFQPGQPSSAV